MSQAVGERIFERPQALTKVDTHYCPGCGHGVAHRLLPSA